MNPGVLAEGVGAALHELADAYRIDPYHIDALDRLRPAVTSPRIRYRDYLRAIWTSIAPKVELVQGVRLTSTQALQQLEARFHQRFTTLDDSERSANEVVIPILLEILVAAPAGGFGFGLSPATIQARGARTARQYLDYLVGLSGVSAEELRLRYRIDFSRPDTARSSPVQENVHALQGFFRDGFQCEAEPYHVAPDVLGQPIVPSPLQGRAPFFLWYEEWLRQQEPFYPENFLDVRALLPVDITQEARTQLGNLAAGTVQGQSANVPQWRFVASGLAIWDALVRGHGHYYLGEHELARQAYLQARDLVVRAMHDSVFTGLDISSLLAQRRGLPVTTMAELLRFMNPVPELAIAGLGYGDQPTWARDRMALRVVVWGLFVVPVCLADAELALGDYARASFHYGQATRVVVGVARENDPGGYKPHYLDPFRPYTRGELPYTVILAQPPRGGGSPYPVEAARDEYYDTATYDALEYYAARFFPQLVTKAEAKLFRLRHANALLEWADALYRANDAPSIARARELYEAVSFLHGETPPICPQWPGEPFFGPIWFQPHAENPAIRAQKQRARAGFEQIEAGLNYFGETNDVVPVLRYRPLKETADRFAALASSAQLDFLRYTDRVEGALAQRMQLSNLLQKARLQVAIGDEQIGIAQHEVQVAQRQVAAVQAQIAAKQQEIADASSLFQQFSDFIGGMVSTVKALPDDTKSAVSAGVVSEATGKALVGEGMLGLGAGASVMTGFGIFVVAGTMSMSSMADAANRRAADLAALRDQALPAAQAAVTARERAVRVAQHQRSIAQADIDLAQNLLAFEQHRLLNVHFWSSLAQLARRLMRRYLDLGARASWLAERALAHEQDRDIRIVRLDYFPERLQGVTGADLLQADLAELEATRIEGITRSVPVVRTLSLVRDFPLAFGQLKQTGRCSFRTPEALLRLAYPGTFGYRIRSVSVTVSQIDPTSPIRGILVNQGLSIARPEGPSPRLAVRPPEAVPLSEFQLRKDIAVFGLPSETLLTFEGTHFESFWTLELPRAANPGGLEGLADVLVTFDLHAQYAADRHAADSVAAPTSVRRWVMLSAAHHAPANLQALQGAAPVATLVLDAARLRLPAQEQSRRLENVAIFAVSDAPASFQARVASSQPARTVMVPLTGGAAMSTRQPDPSLPALPAAPLDALVGIAPDQVFTITIDKTASPGVDFAAIDDLVLALEYSADLA
jgi:hypothetical protein